MPLLTRASAVDLTRSALMLQAKRFQLFQPMGGVRARPFSRAHPGGTETSSERNKSKINERSSLKRAFISSPTPFLSFFQDTHFSRTLANLVLRLLECTHHSLRRENHVKNETSTQSQWLPSGPLRQCRR